MLNSSKAGDLSTKSQARLSLIERLEARQFFSGAVETPYLGAAFSTNQTIPFVDYDKGGSGVAYHDTTPTNLGNSKYRAGDAVDIETGGSTGNVVAFTAAGEWLNYTVNVPTAGTFALQASVANVESGASFHGSVGGTNITGELNVPASTGWQTYVTVTSASFSLSAGTHVLQIYLDHAAPNGAVGNLDWLKLTGSTPTSTPTPTPTPIPPLKWKQLANSPLPTIEGGSIGVGGKLYVFGGFYTTGQGTRKHIWRGTAQSEVYNPATNKWSQIASIPDPETHEECATDGKYIYMAGGNLYDPKTTYQQFATTETWRYDIAANKWSAFVPLPAPRGAGSLVLVGDTLHFFGGVDLQRHPQSTHWSLNLDSSNPQWVLSTPPPKARNHVATFSIGGKIYLMGGRSQGTDVGYPSNDCYVFDPRTSKWSEIASLPQIFAVSAYAVVNGQAVILGGTHTAADPSNQVYAYNPSTNKWSTLNPFPQAKIGPNGGLVGDMLIVSGGDNGGPQAATYGAEIAPAG